MLDRRTFLRTAGATGLAALAGPAVLSACSGDDASARVGQGGVVQLGAGIGPDSVLLSWFTIADRLGYFADEGVDNEIKRVQTPIALVESGRLQGGYQTPAELVPFVAQNPSSDLVVGWTPVPRPFYWPVVPADSDIHTFGDLRGKRIATAGPGLLWWLVDGMAVEAGLKPTDVTKVTVPAGPGLLAALRQHRVDAGLVIDVDLVQTDEQLQGDPMGPLRILPVSGALAKTGGTCLVFKRSTLDRNRDLYVRHLRGMAKGFAFLTANVPAGLSIHLDAYPKLRRAGESRQQTIDRLVREITPRLEASAPPDWATGKHPWGWTYEENLSGWEKIIPVLKGKQVDVSRLYTNDLIGPAYDFDTAAIVKAAREYKIG